MYYEDKKYFSEWRREQEGERRFRRQVLGIIVLFVVYSILYSIAA